VRSTADASTFSDAGEEAVHSLPFFSNERVDPGEVRLSPPISQVRKESALRERNSEAGFERASSPPDATVTTDPGPPGPSARAYAFPVSPGTVAPIRIVASS